MDPTLLAAIIGGISTIAAVVITPIAQKFFETRNFFLISNDRRRILQGKWSGAVCQYLADATARTFNVEFDFSIKGRKVEGTGILNTGELLYHISLDGLFRNDRFLKMDYQNKDINILQFGSFVFHLSDSSRELAGRFVGYGQINKEIIYGSCQIKKA